MGLARAYSLLLHLWPNKNLHCSTRASAIRDEGEGPFAAQGKVRSVVDSDTLNTDAVVEDANRVRLISVHTSL